MLTRPDLPGVQAQHLRRAPSLIPADAYGITALDPGTLAPRAVATEGLSDQFVEAYEEIGGRQGDAFFQHILINKRKPVHDRMLFPDGDWANRLPGYGRLMMEQGLSHAMLVPLVRQGALVGTLHFSRSRSHAPFGSHDVRAASMIMGFAAPAIANALERERLADECVATRSIVRRSATAVVLSDLEGRLVCESDRAARITRGDTSEPAARRNLQAVLRKSIHEASVIGAPVDAEWETIELRTGRVAGTRGMFVTYLRESASPQVDVAALIPPLTRREAEVLECIAAGMHDHETATTLGISVNTVKRHLKHTYRKLDARGRADAVRRAVVATGDPKALPPHATEER